MYPVKDDKLQAVLFDRSITPTDEYSLTNKKSLDLAMADLYVILITTPTIAEGGYQLALTDKTNLMKVASGIYRKYGENDPFVKESTVTGVSPW